MLHLLQCPGLNPTESEVHDVLNRLEDGSGVITFEEFCEVMLRKTKDVDQEICYKQAFRVFYKDTSGCVPAEELKFVLSNLMVRRASTFSLVTYLYFIYIEYKNPARSISDFRRRNRGNDPEG